MTPDEEALFADLEDIFMAVEVEEKVTPVTELSDFELVDEVADVQIALRELEQRITPYTQEARDLHSRNNALQMEILKRGFSLPLRHL